MASNHDEFEDWDADFLDQLLQVEELALSSANPSQLPKPQPPPAPSPSRTTACYSVRSLLPPPPTNAAYNSGTSFATKNLNDISYSPPRELSQRPSDSRGLLPAPINAQEIEIERLKRELERVSNQVNGLEQECMELKRESDEKDKRLKSMKMEISNHPGVSSKCQGANTSAEGASQLKSKACQAIGVQTDLDGDLPSCDDVEEPNTDSLLQKKLESIWSPSSGQKSRNFATKLLLTCTSDFCDLFGHLGLQMSTRTADSLERKLSSCIVPGSHIKSHSTESTRISNLCSVLAKIKDGIIQVDALFNILLDLCDTKNVLVIHKSLCILHRSLAILSTMESRHGRRKNINVEGHKDSMLPDNEILLGYSNRPLSQGNFLYIYQKMCTIAVKSSYKQVQFEAVSIMNVILVNTNGLSEREDYGESMAFEAVAHLLRKEAGLPLQREAVRLLHLMLNCPKLLAKFCLGWKDPEKSEEANDGSSSAAIQVSHAILQGLADCIGQYGNVAQVINLRRNAMVVLAFLASSGTQGFAIVLSHKLSNGVNFFGLILRGLSSDIDAEASESESNLDILKERTLFMREALILLNRHASNPTTSARVLQVLTSNRDMVSLSVDVAARLSRESRPKHGSSDWPMKSTRQSEVIELARVFKKRVFSYLGEPVS